MISSDPFNVTFYPGSELSTVHNVTIVQDNLYEGLESFYLEITQIYAESSLRDQLRIGSSSPVRVIIVDDDGESAAVGAWIACMCTAFSGSTPHSCMQSCRSGSGRPSLTWRRDR